MRSEKTLHIDYADEQGRTSERAIWPAALAYFEDKQVIAAWCLLREDFRSFRIDRVTAARIGSEGFGRRRAVLMADWCYVCDFDHVTDDVHIPIKDQGIVKSPVRIGPDVWVGAKASVLRGTTVGRGCVIAAHAVVRGDIPDYSIVGGIPARVLKDRREVYDAQVARRDALADIARKTAVAAEQNRGASDRGGSADLPGRDCYTGAAC